MIRHTTDRKDMEMFDASGTAVAMEMGLPLEMVVEEVVTHEEGGADADGLTSAMDSLTSQSSVNMLSKFGKELSYLEDSSEDEVNPDSNPALSRLYVSGQNLTQDGSSDVWSGSVKDDCLCWECGERFWSLDLLMIHFRRHEACVRCNMCQVTFRRVVSLSMHLDNVHNNVDLYCNPCRRSFHTKWDLNEHLGKHFEPSEPPITPVLPLSSANPQSKTKVRLMARDTEKKLIPKPASVLVSVPVTLSVPMPLSVPVPLSVPMPLSVPVSLPIPLPVSLPIPMSASGPISVPVTMSVPVPVSVPASAPVSVPVPVPVSVPVSTSVPVPVAVSTPSPSSATKGQDSPLNQPTLHALVARDHTYNNCKAGNGMSATNYALGMSHTKTVTKGFPLQSLPESTNQKNIHLFVFRNVDRQQEKEARVEGGERDWDLEEFVEKDVKPEVSSLIPPLPHSLASSDQGAKIKQEAADPCSQVVPWDGEPIEEDEDLDHSGGELQCDDLASLGDCSEYDPGSDVSSESISSGNSSGSSYTPNKRRGKSGRTRRGHRGRKLSRVASNPVTIAPTQQPVASDSVKFHLSSREQPNPQPSILAVVKQNIHLPDTSTPVANKVLSRPALKPSRMYACDRCREVFPEQVTYRRHHCTLRTAAVMSWSAPTSIPAPATTAATVQNPAVAPITAPMALRTATVPSASNLVSTSGPMPSSSSGVMKVTQMAVPCTIQNSTLVSPLPVASGPSFTLPSIMLPSPSSSVQSGSRPIMATVVFNGNDSAGRVARLVLQSQGLTFPTHTLSQTQPIRLSVPTQANALTPGQARASPSMQLANLMLGSLIQPQTLIKSPNLTPPSAPSPVPAPGPARTPASAPIPAPVLTSAPVPIPTTAPTPTSIAGPAPISTPTLIPATATITMPTPITGPTPITAPAPIPVSFTIPAPLPASFPASAPEPVRILGMFANCSQELALQKRLKKSWRSKGIFLCRQCGAISRQPSLGVRHRYLHRGSRRHRCHCGRTFLHRLHLLRHHVQHAEATRFVCAPCGQTFSGARCLARHKQGREGTRKRKRKKRVSSRKDCHAPFSCDCGQIFQRPTAFLWHKLKNPKE